jgi:hypothetical protein
LPAENHTVNQSFNIKTPDTDATRHLFVFVAKQGLAFVVLNTSLQQFSGVSIYHFSSTWSAPATENAIRQVLAEEIYVQQVFSKTDIIWCTQQSIITPQSFFNRDTCGDMLQLVYGDAGNWYIKSELLLGQNAYNVYRIDKLTENIFTSKFTVAAQSHQSSLLVNVEAAKKDLLYCHFYPGAVTVMLRSNNRLQLVQDFEFTTPEDAVYYLLNVCQRFDIAATETVITATGMIDETSNLYREVYKYFHGINFYELPGGFTYCDAIKTYPAHYFSHLFATAACVL